MKNHSAISLLRKKGYRVTPQRIAVLEILGNSKGHQTAIQIYERAAMTIPGISEATIYRTLEIFGKEGIIFVSHLEGAQMVYELGTKHHHIQCRKCDKDLEIKHEVINDIYAQLELLSGFQLDSSHLTFLGLCPDCR